MWCVVRVRGSKCCPHSAPLHTRHCITQQPVDRLGAAYAWRHLLYLLLADGGQLCWRDASAEWALVEVWPA